MCSGNLINISVDILEQQLRNRNALCLVLDCRPFLAYNESHILNSINIHCPPILRRRKNGYLPLRTIIPDKLTRERLSSKYFHTIILYDDELTFNDNGKSEDSMINLVAKCLQQEADLKSFYVLDGRFSCCFFGHLKSYRTLSFAGHVMIIRPFFFPSQTIQVASKSFVRPIRSCARTRKR